MLVSLFRKNLFPCTFNTLMLLLIFEIFISEKQDFGKIIITEKKINRYFTKVLFTRFRKKGSQMII